MKKIFKKFIIFFVINMFFIGFSSNVFALVDEPIATKYEVTGNTGNKHFYSYTQENLDILPFFYYDDNGNRIGGDASIEIDNPFCIPVEATMIAFVKAPGLWKAAAAAAFMATAATTYLVARFKYQDFEMCGADWYVWGHSNEQASNNVKDYYPEMGAFYGSKKYEAISCMKDISKCSQLTQERLAADGGRTFLNITDKPYRERFYDGEEIANPDCLDPRAERKTYDIDGDRQLYYYRGTATPNFACDRFLVYREIAGDQFDQAYECCKKASKKICVKDKLLAEQSLIDTFSGIVNGKNDDIPCEETNNSTVNSNETCKETDPLYDKFNNKISDTLINSTFGQEKNDSAVYQINNCLVGGATVPIALSSSKPVLNVSVSSTIACAAENIKDYTCHFGNKPDGSGTGAFWKVNTESCDLTKFRGLTDIIVYTGTGTGTTGWVPVSNKLTQHRFAVYSNNHRKIKVTSNKIGTLSLSCNDDGTWSYGGEINYSHTGAPQEFSPSAYSLPNATSLKLEVWGAVGGTFYPPTVGYGGYSYGNYEINSNILYVYVGIANNAFNGGSGGSTGTYTRRGGGATDIRLSSTSPLTCEDATDPRIIVAGGSGGTGSCGGTGGNGGGGNGIGFGAANLTGDIAPTSNSNCGTNHPSGAGGNGGTQTAGGANGGTCGQGGDSTTNTSGGGGGWYGGGQGRSGGNNNQRSGGGGSGHLNAKYLIAGTTGGETGVNEGDGKAKISWNNIKLAETNPYKNVSIVDQIDNSGTSVNGQNCKKTVVDSRNIADIFGVENPINIKGKSPKAFFCDIDSGKCFYDAFIFDINGSETDKDMYCVSTWSLCPYNFNIQKGTEKKLYFSKKLADGAGAVENTFNGMTNGSSMAVTDDCYKEGTGETLSCQNKIQNFHQLNRHCVITNEWPDVYTDVPQYAPYVDKSCINFVGSSHNTSGYRTYKGYARVFSLYKSFSAPIAECINESMKNFLDNRAGHTRCSLPTEFPNSLEKCPHGEEYFMGENLDARSIQYKSPVSNLLNRLHSLVIMVLTLMVTLYGWNAIITAKMDKKEVLIILIKIVIVVSFSAEVWWYKQLFKFTYGFSNTFSALTTKIGFDTVTDANGNLIRDDGCYFGDITDILGTTSVDNIPNIEDNNYYSYPIDRRYVAFFDSLDCKMSKYLGFSVGTNVPNILLIVALSFLWPFNLAFVFAIGSFMMFFFVLKFLFKSVYIFMVSSLALALMLYLSPIFIPCILFKKTKDIFDKWLKNTISYALQPMFLFAFVSMALTIMDQYVIGEGIFKGQGINKELICGYACVANEKDSVTGKYMIIDYTDDRSGSKAQEFSGSCTDHGKVIDLKRNSILCLINDVSGHKGPVSILQSIGIFIPFLVDIFTSDVISILRVAFLFYILSTVLAQVPQIAVTLTDGTKFPGLDSFDDKIDPFKNMRKVFDIAQGLKSIVKNNATKARDKVSDKVEALKKKKKENEGFNKDDNG